MPSGQAISAGPTAGALCSHGVYGVKALRAVMLICLSAGTPPVFGRLFQHSRRHLQHPSQGAPLSRNAHARFSALDFPEIPLGDFPELFSCPDVILQSSVLPLERKTQGLEELAAITKARSKEASQTNRRSLGSRAALNPPGQGCAEPSAAQPPARALRRAPPPWVQWNGLKGEKAEGSHPRFKTLIHLIAHSLYQ